MRNKNSWIDPKRYPVEDANKLHFESTQAYEDLRSKLFKADDIAGSFSYNCFISFTTIWTGIGVLLPDIFNSGWKPFCKMTKKEVSEYLDQNRDWSMVNEQDMKKTICRNLSLLLFYDLSVSRAAEIDEFTDLLKSRPEKAQDKQMVILQFLNDSNQIPMQKPYTNVSSYFMKFQGLDRLRYLDRCMLNNSKFLAGKYVEDKYKNIIPVNVDEEIKKVIYGTDDGLITKLKVKDYQEDDSPDL